MRRLWYLCCKYVLAYWPAAVFFNLVFYINHLRLKAPFYFLHVNHPRSFNEKLNWMKLHYRFGKGSLLADKQLVRDYVAAVVGPQYLVPLLGVYEEVDDIVLEELPDAFVLKTNHGSGWNVLCPHKEQLDWPKARARLKSWIGMNAYYLSREWQYRSIKPMILCEAFLQDNISDYKFFCFNGIPRIVQVDLDRFICHRRLYYDMDWTLLPFSLSYAQAEYSLSKPPLFDQMQTVASALSQGLVFARIDLYLHDRRIYFGEITLCPEGGFGPFIPKAYDFMLGKYLKLPESSVL